jgi:hypothetical protein
MLYVIGTGLLFVSFKMASKFAGTISGFNMAAAIPALGLAASARVAGFAGRNFVGRPALRASEGLKTRAQNAADGSLAQALYKFGSQGLKGVGKSDFNAMRTPLGAGVAGLTNLKADTLAGKKIGGAEGMRKAAAKRAAENAEFLHVSKKDQENIVKDAVHAEIGANPALQERHTSATQAVTTHEAERDDATAKHAAALERLTKAEAELTAARQSGDARATDVAERKVASSDYNMREQKKRIDDAQKKIENAKAAVQNIEGQAKASAIASGNLKEYKKEADLAATLAEKRFTSFLFRESENQKIAQLARKEVGEHHEKKEAKKIADYLKEKAGDDHGHGHEAPKPAPTPRPATPAHEEHHGEDGGGHDERH